MDNLPRPPRGRSQMLLAGVAGMLTIATIAIASEEIVLMADAAKGVELIGTAKVTTVQGRPENIGPSGLSGAAIVQLGTWNKPNTRDSAVVFSPEIPDDGWYDVYVRWFSPVAVLGTTKGLPVSVEGVARKSTYTLTQCLGNAWVFLGTHEFRKGCSGPIRADATGTFGASNINGVKLVPSQKPPTRQAPRTVFQPKGAPDEFDQLRERLAEMLTPPLDVNYEDPFVAERIGQNNAQTYLFWKTMRKGEGVTELWNDPRVGRDLSKNEGGGWPLVAQYGRLVDMAAAYVSSASPLGFGAKMQGNPELLADILYGLEFFYKHRFNERTKNKLGADWIANEMTQPKAVLEIILLVYPNVPMDLVEKQLATIEIMNPDPLRCYGGTGTTAGSNRFGFVYNHVLRGVVEKNPARIESAIGAIWDQLVFNDRANPIEVKGKVKADGFYRDGSFIYHENLPYMTIYGTNVFIRFAATRDLLAGSRWELNDPRTEFLSEWIYRGVEPLVFRGDSFYRPVGRSVGQSWIQNNGAAYILMDSVAQVTGSVKPADKAAMEGMIKRWMNEDAFQKALSFSGKSAMDLPVVLEIRRIMSDPKIEPRPAPLGPFVFFNSDYVVYHRPAFAASLAMSSTRIATHEMMQDVNKRGWYQGDGALFIHTNDPWRYNGDFWPTVNPYRLPGTTIDTQARKEGSSDPGNQGSVSTSSWAGGVALGDFALASMELHAQESSLKARKAWFFFGDQIVCLGAGIRSSEDRSIETIVENAKLNDKGGNAFVVDGVAKPTSLGWNATLNDVKWAHLSGSAPGADIGWVFLQPTTINAMRESRTGKWLDLSPRDVDPSEKTNTFLTFWIDHGKTPKSADYCYIILPGATVQATAAAAAATSVELLSNTEKIQAVRDSGVTGINFWEAGACAGVSSTGKAALLIENTYGKVHLAVSDPTQLEASVELGWSDLGVSKVITSDKRISILSLKPLRVKVDLIKTFGAPVVADFLQ